MRCPPASRDPASRARFLAVLGHGRGPCGGCARVRLHSSDWREMTGGWRPASSHPATAAATGRPTRMSSTSAQGTCANVPPRLVGAQAMIAAKATNEPSTVPRSARAPAVALVIARRVRRDAPIAASVRRSLALSLRIRPTDMASTPSAISIPAAVAPLLICENPSSPDLVSSVPPAAATAERVELIWTAVSGSGVCTSQPLSSIVACRAWTACMVRTRVRRRGPAGQ